MRPNYIKLVFGGLLSLYFLWIAYDPMQGSFLDLVDLPIHETGHLLFRPFGVLNIWVYAADAVVMQLVLTSGLTGSEGCFHDWNYMLTRLGLISSTKMVAGIIRAIGTLTIIAAAIGSIYYSFMSEPVDLDQ